MAHKYLYDDNEPINRYLNLKFKIEKFQNSTISWFDKFSRLQFKFFRNQYFAFFASFTAIRATVAQLSGNMFPTSISQ